MLLVLIFIEYHISLMCVLFIANCWNVGSDWLGSAAVLHDCSRAAELYQLSSASCVEG